MYGLLLESVRYHIKKTYGQEAWDKLCHHCGLATTSFTTANSYSDTLIPKFSDACSKVLGYGLPPDTYMEYFGTCFVAFTSKLGYSNVLKVYSRSFRDFLDNIDSLHEHLRFGFPRLQSPSFECTEESRDGLTLHYRSKRYGYKNYVIGQVKEVAKLYFNMEIEAIVLDEADIVTSFGVRRCHITFRVIFDNSSFTPLVKDYRHLNAMSVPVDLIFNISPFSFLINKDLQIFRASNDLNQYFGENMAGKKILQIFTVRRPPIELTWETLIKHGRVIFELVARQASNISLFADSNNSTSARKRELIERLQRMEECASGVIKLKEKSKSDTDTLPKSGSSDSNSPLSTLNNRKCISEKKLSFTVQSNLEKPSRGILMIRRRSCSLQIQDMLSKTQNDLSGNSGAVTQLSQSSEGDYHSNKAIPLCPVNCADETTVASTKNRTCRNANGIKLHQDAYEGISRPEPIGKQHDISPSNSIKRNRPPTSCPMTNVKEIRKWDDSMSGLHRPEPIGQEDMANAPDIRGMVIVPSSRCNTLQVECIQGLRKNGRRIRKNAQRGKIAKGANRKEVIKTSAKNAPAFSTRFIARKITTEVPRGDERESEGKENDAFTSSINGTWQMESRPGSIVSVKESRAELSHSFDSMQVESLCNYGLFRTIRHGIARVRRACMPLINRRNMKVASIVGSCQEDMDEMVAEPVESVKKNKPILVPTAYSEPLARKPIDQSAHCSTAYQETNSDRSPRRNTFNSEKKSLEDDPAGEKRKKVEMWLQRQQYRPLHLRGQIKYISSWNMVLFIGTPIIGTVDDLKSSGLFLSDLSMHDGSRFLAMQGTQRLSEIEFACDREKLKRELLKETTLKLEEEKRRTEQLLYSMMPREIAERMKNGDRELTTCETFDDVTILFGYVTDFTEICNKVEAMKVVKLVSEVFSLFDILSENHKVYKFETIGGGVYMLVSGVPVKIDEHAKEMASMALSMLDKIKTIVNPFTNNPLELQIGIHSGPVVAGVIGQASLQYCLFGNTVNIASRMQTTGEKMKVHLSEVTNKELLNSSFLTEYRGSVPVKGVGYLDTYWLIGQNVDAKTLNGDVIKKNDESVDSRRLIRVNSKERPKSSLYLT